MSGKSMSIGLSLFAGSLFAAAPTAENVTMTQVEGTRRVEITYDLKNADAVVTLDIETNVTGNVWASIGGVAIGEPTGDVGVKILKGDGKKIVWSPRLTWPDRVISGKGIRAVVTTWPVDRPADYATVDLTSGAIRFYASTYTLPGGFADRAYKTQKILLRRIPAKGKVWRMGSSPKEKGSSGNASEQPHLAMLTDDFYLAVFELTDWQFSKLGGSYDNKSARPVFAGDDPDLCPPGAIYCGRIYNVLPSKIQTLTGNQAFALPTETQWEFACRGGTTTELYTGKEITAKGSNNKTQDPEIDKLAWYDSNSAGCIHEVGQKEPNAFGLYDMLGNATECCSDYFTNGNAYRLAIADYTKGGVVIDPLGSPTNCPSLSSGDTGRVLRGGGYSNYFQVQRASNRSCGPSWSGGAHGALTCRICCPASEIAK